MLHLNKMVLCVFIVLVSTGILFISWQVAEKNIEVKFINDYPRNRQPGWSEEAQGLASDNSAWYISQKGRLWRIPLNHDLSIKVSTNTVGLKTAAIPKALRDLGYNHFGDLDCYAGKLFVPLEHEDDNKVAKIAVFRADDLSFISSADLVIKPGLTFKQKRASWCAVDPWEGILWTSLSDNVNELVGYKWELASGNRLKLVYASTKKLDKKLMHVQGGAFSKHSGLFYMVSHVSGEGLLAWDWQNGMKYLGNTAIKYSPGFPTYQELEGLAVCDVAGKGTPNIKGQVHVVMIENDAATDDDVWIKHFDVNFEK